MTAPWYGWTETPPPLPAAIHNAVEVWKDRTPVLPVPELAVHLPASSLSPAARRSLESTVGADHVHDDDATRIRHTRGKSTPDLVRIRQGDATDAPDAVVEPGSTDEVVGVLRTCEAHRVGVIPYGGGTSVVGGLTAARGLTRTVIALDLRRLDGLAGLDRTSRLATLRAGTRAPDAERLLNDSGFTLGHVPQSFEYATIGGFAATRSAGQASTGYGRFDQLVAALTVATPGGVVRTGTAPASAAGPDLRQLFLGSEGALGVITEVTARVRPVPEKRMYEGWSLPGFAAGIDAVRELAQDGPTPAVIRLSDETESALNRGVTLILGYEGRATQVLAQHAAVATVLGRVGGQSLGTAPGEAWRQQRFHAPYLRDALLAEGVFAETLETATWWSGLPGLYQGVRAALVDALGEALVLCHVSHVYETGASLYFTVAAPADAHTLTRWTAAKAAAAKAIRASGGTITHHHGIGRDHLDGYAEELGGTGVALLRAVKRHLDPGGILNPGALVP
jgi:alkyldihydroxyacetonephosphate synthase